MAKVRDMTLAQFAGLQCKEDCETCILIGKNDDDICLSLQIQRFLDKYGDSELEDEGLKGSEE